MFVSKITPKVRAECDDNFMKSSQWHIGQTIQYWWFISITIWIQGFVLSLHSLSNIGGFGSWQMYSAWLLLFLLRVMCRLIIIIIII